MAGIVGAFLFSLAGAAIWFIIYQVGFIAGIAGIVTIICAIKGYEVFGKGFSTKGLIASLSVTVLMIFISEYLCIGYEIYKVFHAEYGISFFDALGSVPDFWGEPEVQSGMLTDLAMGYGFTLLGSFKFILAAFRRSRGAKA